MTREVQLTPEFARILELPRRARELTPESVERISAALRRRGGRQTLRPIQASALYEAWARKGLFAPIRVGGGKTLISLLLAVVLAAKRPVLLVPAKLLEKTRRDQKILAQHWHIPNHIRIISYESLGRVSHAHEFTLYKPDVIICDEVHKLRHRKTAVTRRVARYLQEHPQTIFCGMSGTVTKRSIRDYEHIIRWALKPLFTPLPAHYGEIEDWSDALDEHSRDRLDPGALRAFSENLSPRLEDVRRGFAKRVSDTPAVINSLDSHVSCSLEVRPIFLHSDDKAFGTLRTLWELPDGQQIIDAMTLWRHARELALGFYYRWDPPAPEAWAGPRKVWAKLCRSILASSRTLDSELAVIQAIDAGKHEHAKEALEAWRKVKPTFKPNPVPVWLNDSALRAAEDWARIHNEGIVWCEHVAFAEELAKCAKLSYYGRSGMTNDGRAIDNAKPGVCAIIASVASSAEGRNLQAFNRNLITSPGPNGTQLEQLLGRTHRDGQEADEVTFDLLLGCRENLEGFWRSFQDAHYVKQSTGAEQKILLADILIPPEYAGNGPAWE